MNTKYIFLDIDGTLVGKDAVIPESARNAIDKARANGHRVFICSGRSRCEMHEEILSVPLDGIVGSAGAYVEVGGDVIYHRPMTEDMNAKLLDYFGKRNMCIFLETNDELFANDIGIQYVDKHIDYCKRHNQPYDKALFDLIVPFSNMPEPDKLPINKLLYVTTDYDVEQIKEDLQEQFTVVDSAIQLPGNSGEISEAGMDKGNGIQIILDYFGASHADTIGIGDGENDVAMLNACAVGIAMGNANPVLKEVADYVTTDVSQDGIWNAFLKYELV